MLRFILVNHTTGCWRDRRVYVYITKSNNFTLVLSRGSLDKYCSFANQYYQ